MLLADVTVHAIDATLEDREIAFNRVSVRVASYVLFDRMIDRRMAGETRADLGVNRGLIGAQVRFLGNSFHQDRLEGLCRNVCDMPRPYLTAALYQRHDGFMLRQRF